MWWSLPLILLVGWISFRYSEFEHASALHAVVFPLLCLGSAMAFAIWLLVFVFRTGGGRGRYDESSDAGYSIDRDIDAGGGD